MTRLGFALALLLGACGAAPGPYGFGNIPGSGTQTLRVDANASAESTVDNATSAANFTTNFDVRISKGGQAVTGATVIIGSANGNVTLTEGGPGEYRGTQAGYSRTYGIKVDAGTDKIDGAQAEGPAFHAFASPTAGQVVKAGMPLEVKWTAGGAEQASIETRNLDQIDIPDNQTYTVAGTYIQVNKDNNDRVRIERSSNVTLAGGAAGSSLTVSVRNQVPFTVTP